MATVDLRKPVFLFGAVWVSWATLTAEISAQARAALESGSLSDAVAEVLRSPFFSNRLPQDMDSDRLLHSATVDPPGVSGHAGPAALQTAPSPATNDVLSRGKVFLLGTLASAAGILGTAYWYDSCDFFQVIEPLRGGGDRPGVKDPALCPDEEGIVLGTGFLLTVALTAVPAGLKHGFGRSLLGSSLGMAGGMLALIAVASTDVGEHVNIPEWVGVGLVSLTHAGITTLIAD